MLYYKYSRYKNPNYKYIFDYIRVCVCVFVCQHMGEGGPMSHDLTNDQQMS